MTYSFNRANTSLLNIIRSMNNELFFGSCLNDTHHVLSLKAEHSDFSSYVKKVLAFLPTK